MRATGKPNEYTVTFEQTELEGLCEGLRMGAIAYRRLGKTKGTPATISVQCTRSAARLDATADAVESAIDALR